MVKKQSTKTRARRRVVRPSLVHHTRRFLGIPTDWLYGFFSIFVLLGSTLVWSFLSAKLHQGNADQLVSPYLFENSATLQQATLPAAHTFLLKWPIFMAIKTMGFTDTAFIGATIALVVCTVAGFAYLLYRIDRRPLIWGSLYLALASVLLFVPITPYSGAILPVNMGMLTTRNIEYIIFVGCLALLARPFNRKKQFSYWAAVVLLVLLIASDKLFIALSIGGAIMGTILLLLGRSQKRIRETTAWLSVTFVAVVINNGLLLVVSVLGITSFSPIGQNSPYGLVSSMSDAATAIVFGLLSVLTNFGANPIFDATTRLVARETLPTRLSEPQAAGYVVNGILLCLGLLVSSRLLLRWATQKNPADRAHNFSVYVLCSATVSVAIFVLTKHYYVVDSRYLALVPFALFIAVATYLRREVPEQKSVMIFGLVMSCCIGLGVLTISQNYSRDLSAQSMVRDRNSTVEQILRTKTVNTLVGDYWRVLPIKHQSKQSTNVTPLEGCVQPRKILSSKNWQPDLNTNSFAYLLSYDKSLTDFPQCKLKDVTDAYGKPNASVVVAGKVDQPQEVLLFYDKGSNKSAPAGVVSDESLSTITPTASSRLRIPTCPDNKPTIMNIVAHQDDDLLFQSPDLLKDVEAGNCIRTVYITAGDAGSDKLYWLGREKGSQAAYASMLKDQNNIWEERTVKLGDDQFVTVASPRGNRRVSVLFMRLPDGNLRGNGFPTSNYESLTRLHSGNIQEIHSVDGQSVYTSQGLTDALASIMQIYQPSEVRTQATIDTNQAYPDHSDHKTAGIYAKSAHAVFANAAITPIKYYIGYPARNDQETVGGIDLQKKTDAFMVYSLFDQGVCHSVQECLEMPTYGSYLKRQYTVDP